MEEEQLTYNNVSLLHLCERKSNNNNNNKSDSAGRLAASACAPCCGMPSPTLCINHGLRKVMFESDCLILVNAWYASKGGGTYMNLILENIKEMLCYFDDFQLVHVK